MKDREYTSAQINDRKIDYDLHCFGGLQVKLADQIARLSNFAELLRNRADQLIGPAGEDASPKSIRPVRAGIVGDFADRLETLDAIIADLLDQEARIARSLEG